MEQIQSICTLREIVRAFRLLETRLIEQTGVDLNEAMIICALAGESRCSKDLAQCVGLLPAHTSKVLASLETKGLLSRTNAREDRRRVICALTAQGEEALCSLRSLELDFASLREML